MWTLREARASRTCLTAEECVRPLVGAYVSTIAQVPHGTEISYNVSDIIRNRKFRRVICQSRSAQPCATKYRNPWMPSCPGPHAPDSMRLLRQGAPHCQTGLESLHSEVGKQRRSPLRRGPPRVKQRLEAANALQAGKGSSCARRP